jgi:hypothetical protein
MQRKAVSEHLRKAKEIMDKQRSRKRKKAIK